MPSIKRITDLPPAGTIAGDELVEVSQPSSTIRIIASTISAEAADNSFNDSGAGFVAAGFLPGDRVQVSGFSTGGNNAVAGVIVSVTAGKIVIGGGPLLADEAAGAAVTIAKWTSRRIDLNSAVAATAAVQANTAKVGNATHTGDVTGSTALTIASNAVSNAKLADMATGTIKGRLLGTTGDPQDLTGTQVTSMLDTFTETLKGLVPPPGGAPSGAFLRDDGTWAVPAGGGSGGIADGEVTYPKIQDVSAASRLLGRGQGAGSGDVEEITLGSGLSMTGTVLNVTFPTAIPVNTQTGSYTLVSADAGRYVRMNSTISNTLTVPPESSVPFPVGTVIQVRQVGSGQTTIVPGTDVTINSPETLALRKSGSSAALIKVGADTWDLTGDLEAAP